MFERFTEPARQVVIRARHEAQGLGHRFIGTEHLLLGLLGDPETPAGQVLAELQITAEAVRGAC